ncbi:hypothetical protein A2U01_0015878 [Trifolium medium]|uniref:Uncharacterized protein n=1 Tax=Trifolium medium TaxID=97028 RepID=A0A392N7D5_9FABA|nr:hypothetical protein [Trifolium medium]
MGQEQLRDGSDQTGPGLKLRVAIMFCSLARSLMMCGLLYIDGWVSYAATAVRCLLERSGRRLGTWCGYLLYGPYGCLGTNVCLKGGYPCQNVVILNIKFLSWSWFMLKIRNPDATVLDWMRDPMTCMGGS